MRPMLILLLVLVLTGPALATDGVLEINQACAVNTGCFPGDDPGFPVTIIQSGSYRLTSSLDLSAEGVNISGVAASVPAVMLDLGGFQIAGPTTCSGSGILIECNPGSTGVGSAGVLFTINATAGVVQNGIVRNMTNFGVLSQATGLRAQGITAVHNGRDGISSGQGSLVLSSAAIQNGQDGIDVNTGSVVDGITSIGNGSNGIRGQGTGSLVTRTSVRGNGMHGFSLGLQYRFGKSNVSSANQLASVCGGGECTDRRRIYLTSAVHIGSTALAACTSGFHMASVFEIYEIGQFEYDSVLGETYGDAGPGGWPFGRGWARTGYFGGSGESCDHWTTASGYLGTVMSLGPASGFGSPGGPLAWETSIESCENTIAVWCVEDSLE
jgi:hypothetical protein